MRLDWVECDGSGSTRLRVMAGARLRIAGSEQPGKEGRGDERTLDGQARYVREGHVESASGRGP